MTMNHALLGNDLPLLMRQVTKTFGQRIAVDALNLEVARGEIVALLGPNGAGKSTTISIALGFLAQDSGDVSIGGRSTDESQARSAVGYIPENFQLYPTLSAFENLEYFCSLAKLELSKRELEQSLLDAGLPQHALHRRVAEFSKGMRQKTGIAITSARQCSLLLLDEPTSGLDPTAADDFQQLLLRTAARGTGILMATHDIARAYEISDRILIFVEGRIAAEHSRSSVSLKELEDHYRVLAREVA